MSDAGITITVDLSKDEPDAELTADREAVEKCGGELPVITLKITEDDTEEITLPDCAFCDNTMDERVHMDYGDMDDALHGYVPVCRDHVQDVKGALR